MPKVSLNSRAKTSVMRVPEELKESVQALIASSKAVPVTSLSLPVPGHLTSAVLVHLADAVNPFYRTPGTFWESLRLSGKLAYEERTDLLLRSFWLWYEECLEATQAKVDPDSGKVDTSDLDSLLCQAFGCNSQRLDELYVLYYGSDRVFSM